MKHLLNRMLHVLIIAALAGGASRTARATLIVTGIGGSNEATFTASSTDLVNAGSPGLASVVLGNYNPWGGQANSGPAINNGAVGPMNDFGATVMDADGSFTVTFNLNTQDNPAGYDITSINTIAAWSDPARNVQPYSVVLNQVGGGSINLGSYMFPWSSEAPWYAAPDQGNGDPQSSQRTFTDSTGTIATNVSSIQFTMTGAISQSAYREIDVFGVQSVPEPSTALLLALGGGLLCLRRRSMPGGKR